MQFSVGLVFVVLAAIVYAASKPDGESYPTKDDNIDMDSIIINEGLLNKCMECIQKKGQCTPECNELKKLIKDDIQNCCEKCSDKQKEGVKKVFTYLEENKADKMKELKQQFDPSGEYGVQCREQLSAQEDA